MATLKTDKALATVARCRARATPRLLRLPRCRRRSPPAPASPQSRRRRSTNAGSASSAPSACTHARNRAGNGRSAPSGYARGGMQRPRTSNAPCGTPATMTSSAVMAASRSACAHATFSTYHAMLRALSRCSSRLRDLGVLKLAVARDAVHLHDRGGADEDAADGVCASSLVAFHGRGGRHGRGKQRAHGLHGGAEHRQARPGGHRSVRGGVSCATKACVPLRRTAGAGRGP